MHKISGRKGQGITEYIILIALVVVAAVVIIRLLGIQTREKGVKAGKAIKEQTEEAQSQYESDKGAGSIDQLE